MVRDFDAAQRGARNSDITAAGARAADARQTRDHAREELAAVYGESDRRADLPPDQRDIEQRVRAEETSRQADRDRGGVDRDRGPHSERSQRCQPERDREASRQEPAAERDVPSR
ncbi:MULTISPECIES: hypothetical protein [Nonomuraea]|uniref:Uncharacterized protein n=1 Tax=Nonomuraea mangrovi TaxID=2316207 RepID=A0ABW4T1G5_9ACTN